MGFLPLTEGQNSSFAAKRIDGQFGKGLGNLAHSLTSRKQAGQFKQGRNRLLVLVKEAIKVLGGFFLLIQPDFNGIKFFSLYPESLFQNFLILLVENIAVLPKGIVLLDPY